MTDFVTCSSCFNIWSEGSIAQLLIIVSTEHNMKLKVSMLTYLTHINPIFEDYHVSMIIDLYVNVLYLEQIKNAYRLVLENQTATMSFRKKTFSSYHCYHNVITIVIVIKSAMLAIREIVSLIFGCFLLSGSFLVSIDFFSSETVLTFKNI